MPITAKTQKMLWGRAAAICSMPGCRKRLIVDATADDDEALIGEACHIVGESVDGPRGVSALSMEDRDRYPNLILMCRNHHREIDAQEATFTVEVLKQYKADHEVWVQEALPGFDARKQADDEAYAEIIDDWARQVRISEWDEWLGGILCFGQPSLDQQFDKDLSQARQWYLSRLWPRRYSQLEDALRNFFLVLSDLQREFHTHSTQRGDELVTEKIYQNLTVLDERLYNNALRKYEFHVALVQDLTLELTRAANYVCDKVRETILPAFRRREGVILISSGPHSNLAFRTNRVEYEGAQRGEHPYPGLTAFKVERETRDVFFAVGVDENDPRFEP